MFLDLAMEGDRIRSLAVKGDFLLERQDCLAAFLRGAEGLNVEEATDLLHQAGLPSDVTEALADLLVQGTQHPTRSERGRP